MSHLRCPTCNMMLIRLKEEYWSCINCGLVYDLNKVKRQ